MNSLTKKKVACQSSSVSSVDLNRHYAAISTDLQCLALAHKCTSSLADDIFSEYHIIKLLDHLHHTAEGLDKLPAWFLRLAAPKYAIILAHLINQSIRASHVPQQ